MEDYLSLFKETSDRWKNGYGMIEKYSSYLIGAGRMFHEDAVAEAMSVATLDNSYLGSFMTNGRETAGIKQDSSVFILGSGNTGLPLILNTSLALLAGKNVYYRSSRGNSEAFDFWVDNLHDALKSKIYKVNGHYDDPDFTDKIRNLPVTKSYLWGGGDAIESMIGSLDEKVDHHVFGPRTGILFIDAAFWKSLDIDMKAGYSQAIYDNLMAFDAALCSSPTRGFILGSKEDAAKIISEAAEMITPSADESERFARDVMLPSISRRNRMNSGWKKYGYHIASVPGSMALLSAGSTKDFRFMSSMNADSDYHSSTGTLDMIASQDQDEIAGIIAGMPKEKRYSGLWSIGHISYIADSVAVDELKYFLGPVLEKAKAEEERTLSVSQLRVVDIRKNIGREPGEKFDGIDIFDSLIT